MRDREVHMSGMRREKAAIEGAEISMACAKAYGRGVTHEELLRAIEELRPTTWSRATAKQDRAWRRVLRRDGERVYS
jgi:hypothetical protein